MHAHTFIDNTIRVECSIGDRYEVGEGVMRRGNIEVRGRQLDMEMVRIGGRGEEGVEVVWVSE